MSTGDSSVVFLDDNLLTTIAGFSVVSGGVSNLSVTKEVFGSGMASQHLKVEIVFRNSSVYSNRRHLCHTTFTINYTSEDGKRVKFIVPLTKVIKYGVDTYRVELVLKNTIHEISSIDIRTRNRSDSVLEVLSLGLFLSKDIAGFQIVNVKEEDVIKADVVQTALTSTEAFFTQYLRTNVFAASAMKGFFNASVNYMEAEEWRMLFKTKELSNVETEQFSFRVKMSNGVEQEYKLWSVFPRGSEKYGEYYTTIHPRERFPDMTDVEVEKYKYLVWKTVKEHTKLAIEFARYTDSRGREVEGPRLTFGAGVGIANAPDRGKGTIYKDADSFNFHYLESTGEVNGIECGEAGLVLHGVTAINFKGDMNIYDNGFEVVHNGRSNKVFWQKDASGQITELRSENGNVRKIQRISGSMT